MKRILLIDCSTKIKKALEAKGFRVSTGTQGFSTGARSIPVAYYEQDLIIYNPTNVSAAKLRSVSEEEGHYVIKGIPTAPPVPEKKDIKDFLKRGGIILAFANFLDLNIQKEQAYYSWIPDVPVLFPTNDLIIEKGTDTDEEEYKPFSSIFKYFIPTLPIKRKLLYRDNYRAANTYLQNIRGDIIAAYRAYDFDKGGVLMLPQYNSNDDIILHFCTHVFPQIVDFKPEYPSYLKVGKSKSIVDLEVKIIEQKKKLDDDSKAYEDLQVELMNQYNLIEIKYNTDETAVLIKRYLQTIIDDQEGAWFFAYKIVERLFKQYGSEQRTKEVLGLREEINYIKEISNKTGRDTRHPPRVGEESDPPTDEENKKIIDNSISLVSKYLEQLAS